MGNPSLIIRMGEKYYNWHAASAIFMSLILFNRPIDDEKVKNLQNETIARKRSWFSWGRTVSYTESSGSLKSENSESLTVRSDDSTKTPEKSTPPMSRSFSVPPQEAASRPRNLQFETIENNYKKSLVLSSEDLKKLNLNYGENKICFFHTNMLQGKNEILKGPSNLKVQLKCKLFISYYRYNENRCLNLLVEILGQNRCIRYRRHNHPQRCHGILVASYR